MAESTAGQRKLLIGLFVLASVILVAGIGIVWLLAYGPA